MGALLNESKIKRLLARHLREAGLTRGAALISELCVADFGRRADLVLANGKLSAFEIKSDIDDLSRLDGQVETFSKYFEALTIVCTAKHTPQVLDRVAHSVGVWEIGHAGFIERQPALSLEIDDKTIWLSHLPVVEIKLLLKEHAIGRAGLRPDLVKSADRIPLAAIRTYVLGYFKRRKRLIDKRHPGAAAIIGNPIDAHRARVDSFVAQSGFIAGTPATPRRC